ncbi:hypothetical protein BpHYR1_024788 [Brachionus plicatilis]|uniref:Uncharacterized protein n=1 Tax=Brachionus plicatilis TaxID=10195 RepID=A0A3M7PVJ2_BRAPC|nr:hypothetical protein BpHYR1_024788 [Brachionus plicatilis]
MEKSIMNIIKVKKLIEKRKDDGKLVSLEKSKKTDGFEPLLLFLIGLGKNANTNNFEIKNLKKLYKKSIKFNI